MSENEMEKWLNLHQDFPANKDEEEDSKQRISCKKILEPEIDLHGLNLDKAFAKLTRFLREQPQTVKKVRIIHGKGLHSNEEKIGVLREEIRKFLEQKRKKKDMVKDFAYAKAQDGGFGVTLVWLLNK